MAAGRVHIMLNFVLNFALSALEISVINSELPSCGDGLLAIQRSQCNTYIFYLKLYGTILNFFQYDTFFFLILVFSNILNTGTYL